MELLESAPTQEEQIHYAFCLRNLEKGWTQELRERYFRWYLLAAGHRGGHSFTGFLANIRKEAIESLSDKEKKLPASSGMTKPVFPVISTLMRCAAYRAK